ncbi:DUF2913 family protein [Paenactinomyces guangxiensis]|uniref:DUF2913 family protein n=1 Tax=Paenactinomyces guangxiensis TaxID=1490290 RepID=A0A7W2A8W3_9BACL|nr:DUF2913 family protein [Paenactinomyces guangxiensis]MBA4495035.1 DUF2913 family protein [Paenactinomyces guangxiensis]MBH8592119.1 DUF2913 family protein [Paenactinomyces guangxiensis]
MQQSKYTLHQSVLDSLTPRERHTYFELVRLAAPEDTFHEEYKVPIPRGGCIISYRQLEKLLDITKSTIRRALTRLVEKDLIELTNMGRIKGKDGNLYRTLCKIKHVYSPVVNNNETRKVPTLIEGIYQLEIKHLANRLAELELLQKQVNEHRPKNDQFLLDLLIQSYHIANNILLYKKKYLSADDGLYIHRAENDLKLFIQEREGKSLSPIELQLQAVLTLLDSLNSDFSELETSADKQLRDNCMKLIKTIYQNAAQLLQRDTSDDWPVQPGG